MSDSDPDKIWERLTMEEKHHFQDMFHSGTLAELIVATPPWWEVPNLFIITSIHYSLTHRLYQ